MAEELWIYASSGDRVAILAPQGLEYIIAFMGVLQAGLIAVPLPVPQFGIHDERISSALRDSAPSIILTTSSVIDEVTTYAPHACAAQGQSAPIVVAVDALDLSSSERSIRLGSSVRAQHIYSTHPVRPARRPVLSSRTRMSSPTAYS